MKRRDLLLRQLNCHPLPDWAAEIDCAIPATRNTAHVRENMNAARGRQPDAALRRRMAEQVQRF